MLYINFHFLAHGDKPALILRIPFSLASSRLVPPRKAWVTTVSATASRPPTARGSIIHLLHILAISVWLCCKFDGLVASCQHQGKRCPFFSVFSTLYQNPTEDEEEAEENENGGGGGVRRQNKRLKGEVEQHRRDLEALRKKARWTPADRWIR